MNKLTMQLPSDGLSKCDEEMRSKLPVTTFWLGPTRLWLLAKREMWAYMVHAASISIDAIMHSLPVSLSLVTLSILYYFTDSRPPAVLS